MDIDLFRDGEQFSTFASHNFLDHYPDDSISLDGMNTFSKNDFLDWEMDHEQEINGDLALIPVTGYSNMNKISESPPTKDDFQKIMNDWQQFINVDSGCEDFPVEDPIVPPEENNDEILLQKESNLQDILTISENGAFDITQYLTEDDDRHAAVSEKKPKIGMKKIDLEARRYIVEDDEDDVDVETVSECENSPVLEAGDLNSLLEQFEATEMPDLTRNACDFVNVKKEPVNMYADKEITVSSIKCEPEDVVVKVEHIENETVNGIKSKIMVKVEQIENDIVKGKKPECKIPKKETINENFVTIKKENDGKVKQEKDKKIKQTKPIKDEKSIVNSVKTNATTTILKQSHELQPDASPNANNAKDIAFTKNDKQQNAKPATQLPKNQPKSSQIAPTESTTSVTLDCTKNKQIIDALPQELIARIKESGKRKTISVIPPMPSKKRGGPKMLESPMCNERSKPVTASPGSVSVQLDHDYCCMMTPYPKIPKKDSGFESAEEDERSIMRKQPIVKNADGKMMVSLLKCNAIRNELSQKKKLNLEEYKKRREGFLKSQSVSQSCSPSSSSCSSPLPEDENVKRLKHQEKLMKMAREVLNTPPKSERKAEQPVVVKPLVPVLIPCDMEKKTLVSVGVNTDFKVCKDVDPLATVVQLEEMKPLLRKVGDMINCNSLITSLIENIPKMINKSEPQDLKNSGKAKNKGEHGEDKTIVYLPKNRQAIKTKSVEVQTNISLIEQSKQNRYRRRRNSSNSSGSTVSSGSSIGRNSRTSSRYGRRRKDSDSSSVSSRTSKDSRSRSYSSNYSSRSSSRSRSRSSSPKYIRREKERLREVEERRVVYVGRISSNTSRDDLRKRFQRFGAITNVSLHFRDHGDNYGFVTFANKLDAYEAIEHGNDDPSVQKYDLSFGGRRIFCKTTYSDLDNMRDDQCYYPSRLIEDSSFDALLREAQEKLRKRKA